MIALSFFINLQYVYVNTILQLKKKKSLQYAKKMTWIELSGKKYVLGFKNKEVIWVDKTYFWMISGF